MPQDVLSAILRGVDRALLATASVGLLAMMLHISADILGSLLFNTPIAVTSAIVTQYYMIAVAFLPIFATELRGSHIHITLFVDRLRARPRRVLETAVQLLIAAFYLLLTLQAWDQATDKLAVRAYMVEQTSRIIVWPSFFFIPVALGAMSVLMAIKALLTVLGRPHPTADMRQGGGVASGGGDV